MLHRRGDCVALLALALELMWLSQQMERCHANRPESLGRLVGKQAGSTAALSPPGHA